MPKIASALHNVNLSRLSFFIPIFVFVSAFIFRLLFRVYVVINIVQVVSTLKSTIPFISILGIILGVLSMQNKENTKPKLRANIFSLIGILLNISLLYSTQIIDIPKVAGTIIDIYISDNDKNNSDLSVFVDLPASKSAENFFNNSQEPIIVILASESTEIYEQVGYWSWQKEAVSITKLQTNQYIEVKYDGWILASSPGQIYAIEITILKH